MSQLTIIDDVFVKGNTHLRKPSALDVIGGNNSQDKTHTRFYSRQFIPFTAERDIRGRIIKQELELLSNNKTSTLWQLSQDLDSNRNSLNLQTFRTQKSLIDSRFKFHQVNHFRETSFKSHLQHLSQFKRDVENLQNKDYERKYKKAKAEEDLWLTNGYKTMQIGLNKNERQTANNQHSQDVFKLTRKSQSMEKLKQGNKKQQSLSLFTLKKPKSTQKSSDSKSYRSLFSQKPSRNPELQQIERNVKVHFNHPELDRLKQSKKLQFKIVENLSSGDKKFKDKIEQYRTIKERIKKEMAKF